MSSTSEHVYSNLGSKLLQQLRCESNISNPLRLLCRDSPVVKTVHRDVLEVSSEYFRQLLRANPETENPISLPVTYRALNYIIEFVYTTNIDHIHTDDVIEVVSGAVLFQIEELIDFVRSYLRENLCECMRADSFLLDQPYETVCRFLSVFPISVDRDDQLKLIKKIHEWAERNNIENARVVKLVSRVVDIPPGICVGAASSMLSSHGTARPIVHNVIPMLITDKGVFQIINGHIVEERLHPALATLLSENTDYIDSTLVIGNEAYISMRGKINVFDMTYGEQTKSHEVPRGWRWQSKLTLRKGRIYLSVDNKVYELRQKGLREVCSTDKHFTRLEVLEHTKDMFKFGVSLGCSNLSVITCNANGQVVNEKLISADCCLIGAFEDSVFAWTKQREVVIFRDGVSVWKQQFGGSLDSYACCGRELYLKFEDCINIIDTSNHSVYSICPAPKGRFVVRDLIY